ncbi:hypothetical protein [Butyrivibrio sp. FC2001]|uniref:hypothetical protein n=1 Tax=Butyrivibrio sp. FC2001 TaxID=1280671 RepID=UPI0003F79A59|nr:hypothetical protein [Butyrivibrio sp. FC2001]
MKKGLKIFSIVILSIISAVAILGAIAFVVIMVIALDADPIIREAYPSPNGDCQIEVVDYWMDDKEYAVYLYVDYPNWLGKYPEPGKEVSSKAIQIKEYSGFAENDYHVVWTSDNTFEVTAAGNDEVKFIRGEVTDHHYTVEQGSYEIVMRESWFDDFEIKDGKVYERCTIHVENTMDVPAVFGLEGRDWDEKGKLLDSEVIIAVDENDNEAVFRVEPNTTENIEVTFVGDKGPEDTRTSRELPSILIFRPVYE